LGWNNERGCPTVIGVDFFPSFLVRVSVFAFNLKEEPAMGKVVPLF
jgi:hypothetical protein